MKGPSRTFNMTTGTTLLYGLSLFAVFGGVIASAPQVETDLKQPYLSVPENTNGTLFTITITDSDPNDKVTIRMNTETATLVELSVGPEEARSTPLNVSVTVRNELDRESEDFKGSVTLKFIVTDEINNVKETSIPLYLSDVNDNKPRFNQTSYSWEIHENATSKSTTFQGIGATDPDNGNNGTVTYSMKPATQSKSLSDEYSSTFEINPANGHVTLKRHLDYEKNSYYQFEITATDGGTPSLNSTAVFIIRVLDVQDTPPFFTGIPYRKELHENNKHTTPVLKVTAVDGDHGIPNSIEYNITGGNCSYLFSISQNGSLTTTKSIDREEHVVDEVGGICVIEIQASEINNNNNEQYGNTTATTTVTITVLDENDNSPVFNGTMFNTTIQENTPAGIPVTIPNFYVQDIDQGNNADMSLSMSIINFTDNSTFEIRPDQVSGGAQLMIWIKNSSMLDYEERHSITTLIVARENVNKSHVASATVVIDISDINDCDPVFPNKSYTFMIPESSTLDTKVGTITATDADSGTFGNITYGVLGGRDRFKVDKYSGEISVNCSECSDQLDREKIDTFYLTFTATDGGGRTRAVPVEIHLNDINDNAPIFLRSSYQGVLDENKTRSDPIVTVEAHDADEGNNSKISYSIDNVYGYNATYFTIISENGSIFLNGKLDYERLTTQDGSVTIIVWASDGGNISRNSTVNVTLIIQDVNDNSPVFNRSTYAGDIKENATAPAEVTILEDIAATDNDGTDRNSQFRFFITAGSYDQFTINATSGMVAVQKGKTLDRDQRPAYNLTIEAIDQGFPSLTGTTTLSVTIEDVNDKLPRFNNLSYTGSVLESRTENVLTVKAHDSDDNSDLNYTITEVSGKSENGQAIEPSLILNYFTLDPKNGTIAATNHTDREIAQSIELTIIVEDLKAYDPKPQNATAKVTITLLDQNDHDPVFDPKHYTVNVSENAEDGPIIATLLATDGDENRTITYTILGSNYPFRIDNKTGALSKDGDIDREENATIDFTVEATDSGVPQRNSTALIHVIVLDFNDNPPEFPNSSYKISILENATVHTSVLTVNATDKDEGMNSKIIYSIEHEDDFSIDNQTGLITVAKALDRETKDTYTFRVIAKDNPKKIALQKSSQTEVTIKIEDINDNDPKFASESYGDKIREDISVDTSVLSVTATDADEDKNLTYIFTNNDTELFSISTVNNIGYIKVKSDLRSHSGSYPITVEAIDSGGRKGNASVNITVTDVNNNAPIISNLSGNNTIKIYECARKGTEVYKFNYTDADKGKNAEAYFNMSKIQPKDNVLEVFEMRKNGSLITRKLLDVNVQMSYRFQISITDEGNPPLSSDKVTIEVKVLDVDDHEPTFNKTEKQFRVDENEKSGTFVGQLNAYDEDLNSKQCFVLVNESTNAASFKVDLNGTITTRRSFDRETEQNLTIKVRVEDCSTVVERNKSCDNATKKNTNSIPEQTIIVTVVDIDDNPPVFVHKLITLGIRRVTEVGTILPLSLQSGDHVTDRDTPRNGRNSWTFSNYGDVEPGPSFKNVITESGTETCSDKVKHLFCVSTNGSVINNKFFSEDISGFFRVPVIVSDGAGNDTAIIKIFLIADSQILRMTVFGSKEEISPQRQDILRTYSEVTNRTFVYDWIEDHKTPQGTVETFKSDMYFHVVEQKTDRILTGEEALSLVDSSARLLQSAALQHKVLRIEANDQSTPEESSSKTIYILAAVIAALGATVCIMIYVTFSTRGSFKRKLKAATVSGHGGRDLDKRDSAIPVPGSNLYSRQSNPLLDADIPVAATNTLDNLSLNSINSLDSNDVDTVARVAEMEYDRIEEKEVTLDMYTEDMVTSPGESPLDAALRMHELQKSRESVFINDGFEEDLETTEI